MKRLAVLAAALFAACATTQTNTTKTNTFIGNYPAIQTDTHSEEGRLQRRHFKWVYGFDDNSSGTITIVYDKNGCPQEMLEEQWSARFEMGTVYRTVFKCSKEARIIKEVQTRETFWQKKPRELRVVTYMKPGITASERNLPEASPDEKAHQFIWGYLDKQGSIRMGSVRGINELGKFYFCSIQNGQIDRTHRRIPDCPKVEYSLENLLKD